MPIYQSAEDWDKWNYEKLLENDEHAEYSEKINEAIAIHEFKEFDKAYDFLRVKLG